MTGAELISAERTRQVSGEGWTEDHDDEHDHGEIALAALAYVGAGIRSEAALRIGMKDAPWKETRPSSWPWDDTWWKPSDDPIRNLTKAGALLAAEIDRLQRAKERS